MVDSNTKICSVYIESHYAQFIRDDFDFIFDYSTIQSNLFLGKTGRFLGNTGGFAHIW